MPAACFYHTQHYKQDLLPAATSERLRTAGILKSKGMFSAKQFVLIAPAICGSGMSHAASSQTAAIAYQLEISKENLQFMVYKMNLVLLMECLRTDQSVLTCIDYLHSQPTSL